MKLPGWKVLWVKVDSFVQGKTSYSRRYIIARAIFRIAVRVCDRIDSDDMIDIVMDEYEDLGFCWDCDGRRYR
jgi:hypothetical protein